MRKDLYINYWRIEFEGADVTIGCYSIPEFYMFDLDRWILLFLSLLSVQHKVVHPHMYFVLSLRLL